MIENVQNCLNRIMQLKQKFRSISEKPAKFKMSENKKLNSGKDQSEFEKLLNSKEVPDKNESLLGSNVSLGDTEDLSAKIERYSKEFGVDPGLIRAVIRAESDFKPDALSKKGAMGLMQLMPGTAKELGVKDPFDIDDNLKGGISYLAGLLTRYSGNVEKALAAYNAGPSQVDRFKGIPPFNETINYVRRITDEYNKK